jgi:hypothetical protein
MVVPLTTGSGADIAGRVVAKSLTDTWKQSVIIENRPGAGGLIGTGVVVNSDPDGYTLLVQSASYAANPAIYKKLPYDPLKSLIDVAILGQTPYVMITAADGPYKSIRDLVTAAKAKPGEITFASAGVGSSTHLAAEYFNQLMGLGGAQAGAMGNSYGQMLGADQAMFDQAIQASLGYPRNALNDSVNGRASSEKGIGNLFGLMGGLSGIDTKNGGTGSSMGGLMAMLGG